MSDPRPLVILSLGAGVQSSTLALMAARGEITPMPDHAIFADTQAEPESVYKWLDWLETQLPYPVHRVTRGDLGANALRIFKSKKSGKHYQKNLIPLFIRGDDGRVGLLHRKCTTDYKVAVIERAAKSLSGTTRNQKTVTVEQWIGISRDEAHRMKESRKPWVRNRWPLVEYGVTRQNCLTWMSSAGYPLPPRSACVFCPYHSDAEWARLKSDEPEAFLRAVEWEQATQQLSTRDEVIRGVPFLHRSLRPLCDIDFVGEAQRRKHEQPDLWGNECEGMCGV